jgi:hypothetical protein
MHVVSLSERARAFLTPSKLLLRVSGMSIGTDEPPGITF